MSDPLCESLMDSPHKEPGMRRFGIFFVVSLNMLLSKQTICRCHRDEKQAKSSHQCLDPFVIRANNDFFSARTDSLIGIGQHPGSSWLWRHNVRDGASNYQPHECLLNRPFRRRSKKTPKLRVTGLFAGNSPETGIFPAQMTRKAENVSIWWRHHVSRKTYRPCK